MKLLSITAGVRATGCVGVAEVWDRYVRPERWSSWSPQIRRVDCGAGRIAPGVTGRVQGPPGVAVDFAVDAVDELGHTWAWTVRRGPIALQLEHGVEPGPGCTTTWLRVHGPAPIVLAYLPLARLALQRLVSVRELPR